MFHVWLEKQLKKHGMRKKELAYQIGVSQAAVSGWVSGEYKPKAKHVSAFAKAFGVTQEDVLRKLR